LDLQKVVEEKVFSGPGSERLFRPTRNL